MPPCEEGRRPDGEMKCQGAQRTTVRSSSQMVIHTNTGTILGSVNRKLDAKKDFEVSQGELGDRFSRS